MFKVDVIPSNPSAKALLLRREKYDSLFRLLAILCLFYNVSVYAVIAIRIKEVVIHKYVVLYLPSNSRKRPAGTKNLGKR